MISPTVEIPPDWETLDLNEMSGVIMVVGGTGTGKSTLARYLYDRLQERRGSGKVAFLDGDPGQSNLGPPATLTLATGPSFSDGTPRVVARRFVGSTSPRGHMLALVVGAARLVQKAKETRAEVLVHDTSGLIDPSAGGATLKDAQIDLLQPEVLMALQKGRELEPLLMPLSKCCSIRIIRLRPVGSAIQRSVKQRRAYRRSLFAHYFHDAHPVEFSWRQLGVFPSPRFSMHRLVSMEDRQGFSLSLGIVIQVAQEAERVTLLTPLKDRDFVVALRLGDLTVDPVTFQDAFLD